MDYFGWPPPIEQATTRVIGRPSIAELEAILNSEEDAELEIMPNGEVRSKTGGHAKKPLTMREHLGGEYGRKVA